MATVGIECTVLRCQKQFLIRTDVPPAMSTVQPLLALWLERGRLLYQDPQPRDYVDRRNHVDAAPSVRVQSSKNVCHKRWLFGLSHVWMR